MKNRERIESLAAFENDPAASIKKLRESGGSIVLTVDGKPELVLQDAVDYRKDREALEFAHAVQSLRSSLDDVREGKTQPVEDAVNELMRRYEPPR
ncbi:MAG: type II toxin-antitoxin system Phd/YefM family antitoxin [bacterium]|nr:type II toxin-antitoxin system Phd/YefM family antitoxin [bacterium]